MPSDSSRSRAEALFEQYLDQLEDEGGEDFEGFVRRHADLADELRRLQEEWTRFEDRLDTALPSPVDEPLGPDGGEDVPAHEPGEVIADYRLVHVIGQGGMGQVWEAEQLSLDRRVALKLLRPGRSGAAAAERLLDREAKAAGRLAHPGIVTVHAAGEVDGVAYIAQELVRGGRTLGDVISEQREAVRLDAPHYRRLAAFFVDIAEALQAAHDAGVLHRDLKPSNILIDVGERPRVGDFGLADLGGEGDAHERGGLVGTYPYICPEQVEDGPSALGPASDVFSLGAVLYEALTSRRAFEGDTPAQILDRVVYEDPPDPRTLRSRIPRELALICGKALEKSPGARYASMRELADDLRRFLTDEPIHARPETWASRLRKWARRRPALSTAVVLGGAALVAVSVLLVREVELRQDALSQRDRADRSAAEAARHAALAQASAEDAQHQSYLANIRAAAMHVDRGEHVEAGQRLDACPDELRGWEWRHYALRADATVSRFDHGGTIVHSVAVSGRGRLVATGAEDGLVRVFSAETSELLAELAGHEGPVLAVDVAGDNKTVVSGGADGTIRVWDADRREPLDELAWHRAPVRSVAISHDGWRIASGAEDGAVRLWDRRAGKDLSVFPDAQIDVASVALDAKGSLMVTGSGYGVVSLWDIETGERVYLLTWYDRGEIAVSMSADGRRIVSGSADGTLRVWDAESGESIKEWRAHASDIAAVALSADGLVVASACIDATVSLWEADTGRLVAQQTGQSGRPTSVALDDAGNVVAASGVDGNVCLWDGAVRGASIPWTIGAPGVSALAVSDDGETLVTGSVRDGMLRVWDGVTGTLLVEWAPKTVGQVVFDVSGDGRKVASAGSDGVVHLREGASGAPLPDLAGRHPGLTCLALDASGTTLVSGSAEGTVRLWATDGGGSTVDLEPRLAQVMSVAVSGDGARVAASSVHGDVLVWTDTGAAARSLRSGSWLDDGTVALSADGRRVAWASQSTDDVFVWDADSGELQAELRGVGLGIVDIALSRDGSRALTGSGRGASLRLWDCDGERVLAVLEGHGAPVSAVAMSQSGRLVSTDLDGSLRVWESDIERARRLWRARAAER